jgi:signal transduction histidine kinase
LARRQPTGTGIGLTNIRERLALLYGNKASLSVKDTAGGGTIGHHHRALCIAGLTMISQNDGSK